MLARLIEDAQTIVALDDPGARAICALLGGSGTTQIVDAHVCTIAVNLAPSLAVTSDPEDIELLITALGEKSGSRSNASVDVIIRAL